MGRSISGRDTTVVVDSGTTVIEQGERLNFAYVVEEGSGSVEIGGEQVGTVDPGEVLERSPCSTRLPRRRRSWRTTSMRLLVIRHGAFDGIIRSNPDLAISLLRTMAKRFHDANR